MPETILDLYARYRRDLYDPVFAMMIRGIKVDLDAMIQETARLRTERDALKVKLDSLTNGVKLYKVESHMNPAFVALQAEKKQWKLKATEARKAKDKDAAKELSARYKEIDAATKSMRADGTHKIESYGDGLSNDKIKAFFYKRMKCPRHVKDGRLTADAAALLSIKEQRADLIPIIDTILDHRHVEKTMQYVNPEKVDVDGRLRFSFNVSGTVTDRFSSSANPRGSGYNIQNVQSDLHHIFLPDENYFFLSVDASAIEDRLVKVRTKDSTMIDLARKKPWEFDAHKHTAALMFDKDDDEITKDERQRAKIVNHARERCMEAKTMADGLVKDGYKYTVAECQTMIDAWDRAHQPIIDWQHRIRMQIITQSLERRRLCSSWGRYIDFKYERLEDSLYRDAISWLPQHECVMLINQYGLVPLWRLIERDKRCSDPAIIDAIRKLIDEEGIDARVERYTETGTWRSFLSAQIHDEVLLQCPWDDLDEAYDIMIFLKASLERTRVYDGVELSVPMEFSAGLRRWAKNVGWKRFPSREEFKAALMQGLSE